MDEQEQELVTRGEAFFHVSGAGHEASAALADHLLPSDYLHCHYRDKALMLARGISPRMFFLSLLCRASSHSAGRQMSAHLSDRERKVLSIPGPVGNHALPAVGVAAAIRDQSDRPIVLCSAGDGTSQQGEFLEAIAEAVRWELPVLFLIHDNRWSISVSTPGKTFFSRPDGEADEFYGMPIQRVKGWDVPACDEALAKTVAAIRQTRKPAILLLQTERLSNHTNADDQRVYRPSDELEQAHKSADPITHLATYLESQGVSRDDLAQDRKEIEEELRALAEEALREPAPELCREASRPLPDTLTDPAREYRGDAEKAAWTMRQAINETLKIHLEKDPRVFLYGQDIEDPKGDVFGVTSGLSTLRPAQVVNAPLSESTIIGTAIGRALAGQKPVAFIQFADFLPLAYNQIASELGSMYWRTQGHWECPVIIMITCGGYRPGLGPFHAQTLESVAAHIPGVDVVMPANAGDAAGMLNAAFQSNRPTLFFYPKNALNDRAIATSPDIGQHFVPIGRARVLRSGNDLTMVGWGNTVGLCGQAAEHLSEAGIHSEVIDLRQIVPWDRQCVRQSVSKTKRLLVIHEDNITGGFGAEVVSSILEEVSFQVQVRRVARADTYVPCHYGNQLDLLPSVNRILEVAAELCGVDLTWSYPESGESDRYVVHAGGSSPADTYVEIVEWKVQVGEEVKTGQLLAEMEGDKAIFELTAPVAGQVTKLLVSEGETVLVGRPVLELATTVSSQSVRPQGTPQMAIPHIRLRQAEPLATGKESGSRADSGVSVVTLGQPQVALGSQRITSEELAKTFPGTSAGDIVRRCGIHERRWAAGDEDALSLAEQAACAALARHQIELTDLEMLICATGTPGQTTPSMACRLLDRLSVKGSGRVQAFDINAACSGYLYALQLAYDSLTVRGEGQVLIVTTEHLSPLLRKDDFDTAIIFGDAASATLLRAGSFAGQAAQLRRPVLSAQGDREETIRVPSGHEQGFIEMKGQKVFTRAIRHMEESLEQACQQADLRVTDLDLIVPHQANQRIIDAMQRRLQLPESKVFSNIRRYGNTSSTSIPLCLHEIFQNGSTVRNIGLCAFGGGFTFGAAVLETNPR